MKVLCLYFYTMKWSVKSIVGHHTFFCGIFYHTLPPPKSCLFWPHSKKKSKKKCEIYFGMCNLSCILIMFTVYEGTLQIVCVPAIFLINFRCFSFLSRFSSKPGQNHWKWTLSVGGLFVRNKLFLHWDEEKDTARNFWRDRRELFLFFWIYLDNQISLTGS